MQSERCVSLAHLTLSSSANEIAGFTHHQARLMPDAGMQQAHRYSAFLSYSHADAAFARRLHRALESYRLPRRLRHGTDGRSPLVRLKPVFRDRDELNAGPDLTAAVQEAITASDYLIVICSAHAAKSEWVGREIALFRHMHGDDAILAALVDGAGPGAFHTALCVSTSDGRTLEPLAADFQSSGDGFRLGLLKLVAALAGLRLSELVQRDAQRRIRQITVGAGTAFAGLTLVGFLSMTAIKSRSAANQERARGEALLDYQLTGLRTALKGAGRLDLLHAAYQSAIVYCNQSRLPEAELEQCAKLLQQRADDDEKRGDLKAASAEAEEAWQLTSGLLQAHVGDQKRLYQHAQSEYYVGFVDWRLGNFAAAKQHFVGYGKLAAQLQSLSPANPDWALEVGYAENNLGVYALRHSLNLDAAESYFEEALGSHIKADRLRGGAPDTQAQIADTYGWLGDVARLRGDCTLAWNDRVKADAILSQLRREDSRNAETRSAMVANGLALARIAACRRDFGRAFDLLREGEAAATDLSSSDPDNRSMEREVRVFSLFRAEFLMEGAQNPTPTEQEIAAAIGDCDSDGKKLDSAELKTFCQVLRAKQLIRSGDRAGATSLLKAIDLDGALLGNRLTKRWGLDLRTEANRMLSPN